MIERSWNKDDAQQSDAVTWRYSVKTVFLKISQNTRGKNLCQSLFFNKVAEKEIQTQVYSCEFWEIFKNTFFITHVR